jgi:dipeptidyl aminopeptidase/acylaminoacyl peptidase
MRQFSRSPAVARGALLLVLLGSPLIRSQAQGAVASAEPAPREASAASKVLGLPDYGRWNRITSTSISPNGKWATYAYQPNDGDATLYVKELDGTRGWSTSIGAVTGGGRGGGAGAEFSDDSRWVAYWVNPPTPPAGRGGRAGGGGGGAGRGGANQGAGPARRLAVRDLTTGDTAVVPNAASFRFARGGRWLAVRANRSGPDTSVQSGDLVLRELGTGVTRNIGNVNLYAFDEGGRFLAWTVDAAQRLGNGVYLLDLTSGVTRPLSTAEAEFEQLAWSPEGTNLAVLRGTKASARRQRDNVLLAWTNLGGTPVTAEYDPESDQRFPDSMVVSEYAPLRWTKDGARLLVGLKEQEAEPPRAENAEAKANVDVWHWKDPEPQSVQMQRLNQERRATWLAVFDVASRRLTRLADSAMRTVTVAGDGRWAIGRLDAPYRVRNSWGWNLADYYRVNLETGARTLIEKGLGRTMGTSPDGRWFLYLKDRRVYAYDLDAARAKPIDGGRSFVNEQDDHAAEKPSYGVAGWSKDGKSVLLNHRYDLWQLSLDGGRPVNVTAGVGDREQIRFRLVRFGGGGFGFGGGGSDDEGIDLSKPLTLSAYGEWTKKTGYWQVTPGQAPRQLIWADKSIGSAQKADSADRVLFTQQTFQEFPDVWVSDARFTSPRKLTDANPHLAEYGWGSKVLVDYRNSKGQRLQATLTLPAGYEPGKRYPMLVYFYEIMSNTHHQFSMPVYDDRPHISTYASDGYLVLQPDVVYELGKPGSSALDCVTAAVKKVIELGYADPAKIGLQGHSWGGYQSSFIVTQTDLFAAVVTGAPLTNLISMYNILYKSSGTVNGGILEMSQGRMGADVTPATAHDLYESQSPVFHVRNIRTPFLILHGTEDGAVDWNQGVEFYNLARRHGKEVILLSYPGEPHHLARKENQKDFQVRMKQYFDHYLKGAPAPSWMTDGVPQVRK